MVKRKRLDRDIWTSIQEKKYIQKNISNADFNGIFSLLYLQYVEPISIWKSPCGDITVCETGMKWLQFLPRNENYCLTAMINAKHHINVFYIDIISGTGIDTDGVAFFDDLYLDLVMYPSGNIYIDDRDELLAAFQNKVITQEQYSLAEQTQAKLLNGILRDISELKHFCYKYLAYFPDNKG